MAFTDSFVSTAGLNLTTYSANWSMGGDGGSLGGGGSVSYNSIQVASSGAGIRDQNVGNNTWSGCPDQGYDATKTQYIKVKYGTNTPNNQLRGVLYLDSVAQEGIIFSLTTGSNLLLRHLAAGTPVTMTTSAVSVNTGDTVHVYAVSTGVSTFTCHFLVNGSEDTNSPISVGPVATLGNSSRQGLYVLSGQSVIDPWIQTFEAGSGTGLSAGGGSTRIRAVNFYSMMRNQ